MKIYVIRHGETQQNIEGVIQGQFDSTLTCAGVEMARAVGVELARKGVHFDAVFTSPLSRAKNTALAVLNGMGDNKTPIVEDARIAECCMGSAEGKHFRKGECEIDASVIKLFWEDPFAFPGFEGGELARDVIARTQEFLFELAAQKNKYETVLVSTHGFALRGMLNCVYENKRDYWHGHVPYNCSVSIVESSDEGNLRLVADDVIFYDESLLADYFS